MPQLLSPNASKETISAKTATDLPEKPNGEDKKNTSKVYEVASRHCKHLACPVPCGIIKGIEAACGLALPKDVEMKIQKK